jgi:hypothetical protein
MFLMCSNESPFCLWQNDRRVMVKRLRGETQFGVCSFAVRGHGGVPPGVMDTDPLWSLSEAD